MIVVKKGDILKIRTFEQLKRDPDVTHDPGSHHFYHKTAGVVLTEAMVKFRKIAAPENLTITNRESTRIGFFYWQEWMFEESTRHTLKIE